jgi:hypothetical protein
MANNKKNTLSSIRSSQRSYLNRDFDTFRSQLTDYSRAFFSDKIADFGPNGFAGMFIELASYVGDVMSFYMDHQFNELDIMSAVENENIERLVRNSGVKITGAAPSTVDVNFYLEVPSIYSSMVGDYIPNEIFLPIIKAGTVVSSNSGINFTLTDDIIFSEKNISGNLSCEYVSMKISSDGSPSTFSVKKSGLCVSAKTVKENFSIGDKFMPFRTITLSSIDVSEIISIVDSSGNEYYQVDSLTQDTVFRRVLNTSSDSIEVPENLELISAPYRFISQTSNITKKTTIRFGGGSSDAPDSDMMPDPSDLTIPLYGKRKTISTFTIDPNRLLKTTTLGVSPQNTQITVTYRSGGGISHNVAAGSIRKVSSLKSKFNSSVNAANVASIRSSIEVTNKNDATGGEQAPTINELRSIALSYRNSQSRIVTKEDLIARIYTMPSKFGRVFRIGIRANPNNPLSSELSIISRNKLGKLIISPDSLKQNLSTYLNESRLISDAIDIVDAAVINVALEYGVVCSASSNPETVIQLINKDISEYCKIENFQIEQPIFLSDLANIIINNQDVVSLVDFTFYNMAGVVEDRIYSDVTYAINENIDRGILVCPAGSIFEFKFPNDDIVGVAR